MKHQPELKNCPFCGNGQFIKVHNCGDLSHVGCAHCGACGPDSEIEECVNLWNKRNKTENLEKLITKTVKCKEFQRSIKDALLRPETLTRDQAIKRIMDIREGAQIDHLKTRTTYRNIGDSHASFIARLGAEGELMAIFDIEEAEIK